MEEHWTQETYRRLAPRTCGVCRNAPSWERRHGQIKGHRHAVDAPGQLLAPPRLGARPHAPSQVRRAALRAAQPTQPPRMSTYEGNEAAEITPQEENQLRRVHRLLCDYGAKKKVLKLLRPKQDQLEKLRQSADDEQADILVASEIQSLETDVEKLRQDLQEIEKKSDGLVSCVDLLEALKTLGRKAQKKDAEAMIWEVDEDLDGCVSWDEMRLMFQRNIRDTTGLEPSQLFNVVMFLIFDLDEDGMVSVDETMELLYARYGRHKMEDR